MIAGRIIVVPIWNTRLYIYYGPFAAFVKWLRRNGFDDTRFIEENEPSGCRIATTYSKKDGRQIIYSRDPMDDPSLVHDLWRAVKRIEAHSRLGLGTGLEVASSALHWVNTYASSAIRAAEKKGFAPAIGEDKP